MLSSSLKSLATTPPPTQGLSKMGFKIFWIIAFITVFNSSVHGAPSKLDSLRPSSLASLVGSNNFRKIRDVSHLAAAAAPTASFDSYGNPIEARPIIETPDGRKVVSAQGLQFEIPNYASGITEIKKPLDDLLPPFIDHIGSATEEQQREQQQQPQVPANTNKYSSNPFLFGQNKNSFASKATTTTRPTTTTTTTTPAPPPVQEQEEGNPFDSQTIPPWLTDFDYADVGPGVPFNYDPQAEDKPINAPFDEPPSPQVLAAPHESFPPFANAGNVGGGGSINGVPAPPPKTTFSKSEDGKVITNNIFLQSALAGGAASTQGSPKPFGFGANGNQNKDFLSSASSSTFSATTPSFPLKTSFGTTFNSNASGFVKPSTPSGFSSFSSSPAASANNVGSANPNPNTFSGRFGETGFAATTALPTALPAPLAPVASGKYTGRFGGPPGVLTPYDNSRK